jgi:NADH-quinone oxidoreductase subunit L
MAATLLLLTIAIPWVGGLVVWLVGNNQPGIKHRIAVAFALLAGGAGVALIPYASSQTVITFPVGSVFGDFTFVADGLGIFLTVVATVIGSLAVIFSVDYMHGEDQLGRYYAMVLFFIGGMSGLVLTSNMLLVFFFWEITALCSYALISFYNDDPKAVAAGIKALIITQFGGVGLLAGALLLFAVTGSMDFNTLINNPALMPGNLLAVMAFGFLVAAAAKSAQFPFQTWLPDAMEAPTPISALIHAATMVNAGVYLMARFYPAFKGVPGWTTAVLLVGMVTAIMAAIMALVSNDLKRVLAYSTVSQLGYMFYAVGAGGLYASQFHLFSHSIFKALLFLSAGAIIHSVGTRDMRQMGGLGKQMPLVRAVFIIGGLALAGLPILNGFWSKEMILEAGLAGAPIWTYIVMLLGAGLTALYTFRCVWMVFYGETHVDKHVHDAGPAMKVALIPLAFASLTSWLLAGSFGKLLGVETLPAHGIEISSLGEVVHDVLSLPTLIALAVIALGLAAWWWRDKLTGLANALKGVGKAATESFGFEAINRGIVKGTQDTAEALRVTQTGLLNWNILGIIAGLILVLLVVVFGG